MVTRTDLTVTDTVHDNPGLAEYESQYTNPAFLTVRGYDGIVFDLFDAADFGLLWDDFDNLNESREKVFPYGSDERKWAEEKRNELTEKYNEAVEIGQKVYFMMDIIVLPSSMLRIYPEILNKDGKIDIMSDKMEQVMDCMFDEMFSAFPQITGIYIRYGETYVGERYNTPYHIGNNPIVGKDTKYHNFLIEYLREKVCEEKDREIIYRTWGFSGFQNDKKIYTKISNKIDTHENLFFSVKYTTGDFHRDVKFNQCVNAGKHKQIVEVQCAREYEGKGAYPNYVASDVINGAEEYEWLMSDSEVKSLSEAVNRSDSVVTGIWTWSRGGGWDGPYINGANGENGSVKVENGSELWCDVNAYVISKWVQDTSKTEKEILLQYAREILSMNAEDAEIFYNICIKSSHAVLYGRGTNSPDIRWDVWWMRDQNIRKPSFDSIVDSAAKDGTYETLLSEKAESVKTWKEIVDLAKSLSDDMEMKDYIVTTSLYGLYQYSIFNDMFIANIYSNVDADKYSAEIKNAVEDYEKQWKLFKELYETKEGCPTLFIKDEAELDLIGYRGNVGTDAVMKQFK